MTSEKTNSRDLQRVTDVDHDCHAKARRRRNEVRGASKERGRVSPSTEAERLFERNVRLVTRNSYGHHYRRVVPLLLEALEFKSNNDRHRPVMRALELLKKHRERIPSDEDVPLEGVVQDD